jgi:dTDP-4-dehydrorhamnose reductase
MRILLFGKDGQVARALQEEVHAPADVVAFGRKDVDLMQPGAGAAAIAAAEPDVVINAAAYTAVDKAEEEEAAADRLNHFVPGELAKAAKAAGASFIHVSTDYVFDGAREHHHLTEKDPTGPLNVYGRTKLAGENAALAANDKSIILRTSWVFSEYGANFVKTMLRLSIEKEELNIVSDQVGGPTAARDIAKALLVIAGKKARGAGGAGVYHYQGTPAVSWAALAEKIFEIAQRPVKVIPIATADYPTPAKRPLNTVLDCARIERDFGIAPPDWRIALRQVIAALDKEENA